ncbi:MAG: DUF177 domain-containing protein [Fidelibacterota bacterium]|nr:MAG: DUF177 domain-containing protein [Candidatus Neomarinimicrobiota bacterium]
MKILRGDLQHFEGPQVFRVTLFDIGINDLGNPGTEVEIQLDVHQHGDDLLLQGTLQTDLILTCDRCLGKASLPIQGAFAVWLVSTLRPDLQTGADDILVLPPTQQEVDLSGPLMETIYVELPQKLLCQDDCKGLCPTCGADLNNQSCGCVTEEFDERWAGLKAIKQKLRE